MKVLNKKPIAVAVEAAVESIQYVVHAGSLGQRDDMADFPIHKTDMYRTCLCTWEMLPLVVLRTYASISSLFFDESALARLPDNALRISPDDLPTAFDQVMSADAAEYSRVRKHGNKGFSVSYCLASGFFPLIHVMGMASNSGLNTSSVTDMMALKARLESRWPQFFDLTKPIDFALPTTALLENTRLCSVTDEELEEVYNVDLGGSATSSSDDEEVTVAEQIRKGVAGVRITMSAGAGSFSCHDPIENKVVKPNTFDELPDTTATTYSSQNNICQFIRHVINTRLNTASAFVNIKVPREVAEYVTQSNYDEIRPQYLAAFFKANSEFYFRKTNDAINYLTPLSQIRDANKKSRIKPKRRTNDGNLMIDRRGRIYFCPEVDNIDFVESEVETEGLQDNGEWTSSDSLDPAKNNYTSVVGVDNVERRVKKRKGANRIVYTDWINSRFAYTDSMGNYRTMDVMSSRPVSATHLVPVLNARTQDRTDLKSLLEFIGSNARKFGIDLQMNEEDLRGYVPDNKLTSIVSNYNNGQLVVVLNEIADAAGTIFTRSQLPDTNVSREYVDLVQEDFRVGSGFVIDYISEHSPIRPYRAFWKAISAFYAKAMDDLDVITRERSVPTALQFLGMASIVTNYCGKKGEIEAEDLSLRQKFLEDVGDPRECVISGIPFVKELTLAPHQVKAWNMIKNSPDTAVIDIAAGGGKTIMALIDIADQLGKGMRRPLVLCPNNLIKNYVIDALVAFKGRVNTVVLNTATLRSWGEDRIRELVLGAPVNTIFLSSYEFLSGVGQIDEVSYGMTTIKINKNCEYLREFEFGGVWMDESQFLKNEFSQRSVGVARLVAEIPYKREMTGTYIQDNLGDVVSQFALLNPQVFGTIEDFKDRFGDEEKGRNAYAADAPRLARKTMEQYSRVVTIKRREWMALLPPQEEEFHPVELTENQMRVYDDILREVTENINAMLESNPKLRAMMERQQESEDIQNALEALFSLHTQRLERFLTAPQYDETGSVILTEPEDRISPKAVRVHEICRQHINDGIPGKILIFTQNIDSARAIYETAPADLKRRIVHYTAARQEECAQQFESDPEKMIMVGVEKSMNTGKNFQFCSRLIRVETVWNWGMLEQGEARILRPNFKVEEFREKIYVDWVFVDGTADVSKMARMFAKLMSTAKFYEPDDPRFQNLPALDYVPVGPEALRQKPAFREELADHLSAYQQYRTAEFDSYQDFLANPDNIIEKQDIPTGDILPGSAILKKVPYIPNIALYGMDELGLMKYSDYANQEIVDQDVLEEFGIDEINDNMSDDELKALQTEFDPTGLIMHTEDGEGECVGPSWKTVFEKKLEKGRWVFVKDEQGKKKPRLDADGNPVRIQGDSVRVRGEDGKVRSYPKTMVFVVTKKTADSSSIRAKMARLAGADVAKTTGPKKLAQPNVITDQGVKIDRRGRGPVPNTDTESNARFEMFTFGYNDMFCLGVDGEDPDVPVAELKSEFGFVQIRPYYYAEVPTVQKLIAWYEKAKAAFNINARQAESIEHLIDVWSRSKSMLHMIGAANPMTLRDFFLTQKKANSPGSIKPYVSVQGLSVFLCFDALTHKNMAQIKSKVRVPGITFEGPVEDDVLRFCRTKSEAKELINTLTTRYTITNRKELVDKFNATRVMTLKTEERE